MVFVIFDLKWINTFRSLAQQDDESDMLRLSGRVDIKITTSNLGESCKSIMISSGLPPSILAVLWAQVDSSNKGSLTLMQFCHMMQLIEFNINQKTMKSELLAISSEDMKKFNLWFDSIIPTGGNYQKLDCKQNIFILLCLIS